MWWSMVSKPRPLDLGGALSPTAVANVLNIQPWPIYQKQIATSQTEQHTDQHCEPTRATSFNIRLLTLGTGV